MNIKKYGKIFGIIEVIIIFFTMIPSADRNKDEVITYKVVFKDLKDGFTYLVKHPTVRLLLFMFTFIIIGTAFAGPLLLPYLFEVKYNAIAFQYFNTPNTLFDVYNPTFKQIFKGLADREC